MPGENKQLSNGNNSNEEIIINDTSNDCIYEISDDDDDLIDLSHIIEGTAAEDIDDLRIIFKEEIEDVVQTIADAVDNRSDNPECGSVNQNSLAGGKKLKRTHAESSRSLKKQTLKIAKVSSQKNRLQAASDVITLAEFSDSDSVIIKSELPESSAISVSCSSIKSEPDNTLDAQTTTETDKEAYNSQAREYDYDLSKLKWLRPLKNLSSPPHLQIVIIDLSHPLWTISMEKWLIIEKRLLENLHDEMLRKDDNSIGFFDGAKWTRGIKVVGCGNQSSLNFITQFILNKDNLWPGANLDVIPINKISRHIVRVYVPPPELSKTTILSFIKLQNPLLYCDDWEIIRELKSPNGNGSRQLWISINTESLEYLRKTNGEIKFGINRIWFKPSH